MPTQSGYNPLEALLLFQSLWASGVNSLSFNRVSDQLKSDPDVRSAPDFDEARLTPDALKEYFIRILNDEAKVSRSSQDTPNGASASSPKKRKAPSPTLPSLQDVSKNLDLMPKLILKLYSRCREQIVNEIRESEKKYTKAKSDITAIERGDWDIRIQDGLAEGEKLKTTSISNIINGDMRKATPNQSSKKAHLDPGHSSNHYTQRTPSPTSTTIELPRTVPRPQNMASNVNSNHQTATPANRLPPNRTGSYSQPVNRNNPVSAPVPAPAPALAPAAANYGRPLIPGEKPSNHQSPIPVPRVNRNQGRLLTQPVSIAKSPSPQQYPSGPQPSSRGGVMLQPFQVSPQIPTANRQNQSQPPPSAQSRAVAPKLTTGSTPSTPGADTAKTRSGSNPMLLNLAQSLSNVSLLATTPRTSPSTRATTPATTFWKPTSDNKPSAPPSPIRARSISPIDDLGGSDVLLTKKGRKSKHDKAIKPSRRPRAASTASSAVESSVRGRSRSLSIVSHTSADGRVKNEPASTPLGSDLLDHQDGTPMPAPPKRGPSTRMKRKRSLPASEASMAESPRISTSAEPESERGKIVLAVRNFPRVSNAVFGEITSHKHAGLFSNPVRERDAEGYSSIIRRPTDLKTIKAAMQAGSRAIHSDEIANATISASGASTSSRDATALILPWNEDLVSPKGIVNSAQLEKELMRMFANAVMFSPGNDAVGQDAIEMFEQVQQQVTRFRDVEKGAEQGALRLGENLEEDDEASTPTTSNTTSKRRRVM